ncbi:MAG: NAD-dependent epimerase/dehydratase family protein [Dehalococcoidia bacterium]|nr:NAD-dependent epimerase/dehydratase family protein [Dehalococcoidia bacterium]
MRVFVAGAWGVVGRVLCPLLLAEGHDVTGTTRSSARATAMRAAGVAPVQLDVYDAKGLARALQDARPQVVIHQRTDLAELLTPRGATDETFRRNARLRIEGTCNLVSATLAAGAPRLIAQSICWLYTRGAEPHSETDPPYRPDDGSDTSGVDAVLELERTVTSGEPGIYNVAEDNDYVSTVQARTQLGWLPDFRVHTLAGKATR